MKITKRQKEIVDKMKNGWILIIGRSEMTGRTFYCVSKGMKNDYFNATVFINLLNKNIIHQRQSSPHDYILTENRKTKSHEPRH